MHIEKNVCDNLLGTVLNIDGKTKDTFKARLDLQDLKIRRDLHLKKEGDKLIKPHATYTLTSQERNEFLNFIKSVKVPDGFGSNISRCVSLNEGKFQGLKTHDCHILLQRLIPVGVRKYLPKDVSTTITEFCRFFYDLCSKTLRLSELDRLENEIVIILCKMEKIFPPAFFDVMVHLVVHLPYECKIVGPVHYSWMYPFERSLGTHKGKVRNRARVEGCIAEEYVMNEFLNYCSSYFNDMETRLNRPERNEDNNPNMQIFGEYEIYRQNVRPLCMATNKTFETLDKTRLHSYILNNCDEIRTYVCQHIELIRSSVRTSDELYKKHEREFPEWFKKEVLELRKNGNKCDDLYALAMGPTPLYRSYSTCIVNRVRYNTLANDKSRVTQNCGIMVEGEGDSSDGSTNFYGVLTEVIEASFTCARKVMMFRCDWFNTDKKKGRFHNHFGIRTINTSSFWFKNEPFILANQAKQIFYIDDPKHGKDWKVVQLVSNKSLWDVPEMEINEIGDGLLDQPEDMTIVGRNNVEESLEDNLLCRFDVEPTIIEQDVNDDHDVEDDNMFINDDDEDDHDTYSNDDEEED